MKYILLTFTAILAASSISYSAFGSNLIQTGVADKQIEFTGGSTFNPGTSISSGLATGEQQILQPNSSVSSGGLSTNVTIDNSGAECSQTKSCEAMGYTKSASECQDGGVKCPWDASKMYCKTPACPEHYYKDCAKIDSHWSNNTSKVKTLSDGSKCYSCMSSCSAYGYLATLPNSSIIGVGCNYKAYNSCSTFTISMPNSTGTYSQTCHNCIRNPYGEGRGVLRNCSGKQYCCGSGGNSMTCENVISGVGGCISYTN